MVEGFKNKVVGKQTLTAKYGEEKGQFEVTVKDNVNSIAVSRLPDKTEYIQGGGTPADLLFH